MCRRRLRDHAQQIGAELWCIGSEFGFTAHMGQWDYRSKTGSRSALPIPALRGAFQLNNASAVLAALDALKEQIARKHGGRAPRAGRGGVAGRFQFVPGRPQLILDVAHNPHAARSLAKNLANLPPAKTFAVFAMLKDKDMAGVVRALDAQVDVWLVAGIRWRAGQMPRNWRRYCKAWGYAARLLSVIPLPMPCMRPATGRAKMIESRPSDHFIR